MAVWPGVQGGGGGGGGGGQMPPPPPSGPKRGASKYLPAESQKQYSAVLKHESSCAHRNAIVSQALFCKMTQFNKRCENARKRAVIAKNMHAGQCWNVLSTF